MAIQLIVYVNDHTFKGKPVEQSMSKVIEDFKEMLNNDLNYVSFETRFGNHVILPKETLKHAVYHFCDKIS